MVLPFHRQPLLHKRYAFLTPQIDEGAPPTNESETSGKGDEYANFLRSLASGQRQDDIISRPKALSKSAPALSGKDLKSRTGSPRFGSVGKEQNEGGVVYVSLLARQNQKDHKKKMRVIEDHMLQHKQAERELKRAEGDIIKKQHHLRRSMMDYENTIYKKKRREEVKLSENSMELEKVKQQHSIQEERLAKGRTERNISANTKMKDKERKATLVTNSIEFEYHKVSKELDIKRNELARLTSEFEGKMKAKEEEEFRLKKQLAELAITVNMEAQKKRTQSVDDTRYKSDTAIKDIQDKRRREGNLEDKLRNTGKNGVKHEFNKRKHSKDLINTKDTLSLKGREEGRKMTDIHRRLQHNSTAQRQAQHTADYFERERQGKEIEERGQFAQARRNTLISQSTEEKKFQHSQQIIQWKKRYIEKRNEAIRRNHQDHIRHLQKSVSKLEETEHALYNRVRAAEMQRRKQEQLVQRLDTELDATRRENARKLKEATVQCSKKEKELELKLLREQAELAKLHSQREESIQSLGKQRVSLREDRHMLEGEEREHGRIARIGQRTDHLEQETYG